jgi:hypothetical protein
MVMDKGRVINLEYGGLCKSDLLMRLDSSGILLNDFAKTILSSELFKVSNQKQQISIYIVSIKEIGFSKGATIPQIKKNIKNYGLSECPLEIAPYLRLYLKNQKEIKKETLNQNPLGSLTIFSKPLVKDEDFPKGFYLRKIEGKLWLRGYRCSLDYIWNPNDKLIFQLNNK